MSFFFLLSDRGRWPFLTPDFQGSLTPLHRGAPVSGVGDSAVAMQVLESPPPPRHTLDLEWGLSSLYRKLSWVRPYFLPPPSLVLTPRTVQIQHDASGL
jgi:hypothetical protein